MMDNEYVHAEESIQTGIYVPRAPTQITYANPAKKSECTRVGKASRCFCGHLMTVHNGQYFGKKFNTACKNCPCKKFKFVPTRPEECGMYWLPRRKDFNVHTWRPPCKCKHHCEEHDANYPLRCRSCTNCQGFNSNFACISCDDLWENHEVLYETADERKVAGKPVGKDYLPLATHTNIQRLVFKTPNKYKMIEGDKETAEDKQKMDKRHASLNPKQPTKQELAVVTNLISEDQVAIRVYLQTQVSRFHEEVICVGGVGWGVLKSKLL